MLQTLTIHDLALIHRAEISLAKGLNVISGETGGGKSLIITALKLLRGGKASADMVRHGAKELRVDAEFRLGEGDRAKATLQALRQDCGAQVEEEGLLLLTRVVDAQGRSKVRLNGQPSTLAMLRQVGGWLLEIHGQGDSRALMRPEIQCETLDAFAGTQGLRQEFAAALTAARKVQEKVQAQLEHESERLSRLEFLRFQTSEMEALEMQPGELARLVQEHALMAHVDRLRELLNESLLGLQDGEPAASDLLAQAERALTQAAGIDKQLAEAETMVSDAAMQVAEACRLLQSGLGRLDLDPARLQQVEDRLAELRKALGRFGPEEQDFFSRLQQCKAELVELESPEHSPEELQLEAQRLLQAAGKLGQRLTKARRKAAKPFASAVQKELAGLGMAQTVLQVAMGSDPAAENLLQEANLHGPTMVDFEVRINPGEPFRSMKETASGGEMARLVLAVKKCIADQDRVPFLVFDEVDAEIGGRLGLQVGTKLRDVSLHHQVCIVTHLPQVAAFAETHIQVAKTVVEGRTQTQVRTLDQKAVEQELAAMAVGEGADASAIQEARRLVARARQA